MVNQQQDQNSGTNWQDEARRQASMYPNLEEFLNRMMPDNQSDFLREFFSQPTSNSNSGSGSSTSNAPPSAPPAQENSEENGANNSQNTKSAGGWNWQNWSDNWQNYHTQQQQQRPNNFQNNQRTEMFNEDDFSFLLQRIGQKMAENFAKAIGKLRSFRQIYDLVDTNANPIAISIFTYLIYICTSTKFGLFNYRFCCFHASHFNCSQIFPCIGHICSIYEKFWCFPNSIGFRRNIL